MDELFASGNLLAYTAGYGSIFEFCDEFVALKIQGIKLNFPSFVDRVCLTKYQTKVSIVLVDNFSKNN